MNSERKLPTGQRRALYSDVQTVIVGEEHQQEWSSSLDQEDKKPPHCKEEQEELRISQKGEQLQRLKEADTIKCTFTPFPVKNENDEENPQFSKDHHKQTVAIKTEVDGADCGGPEAAMNSVPDTHLQPDTDNETGDSSEPETDDSADWKEPREPLSGLTSLNETFPVSDLRCSAGEDKRGESLGTSGHPKRHTGSHTVDKPFSCSVCKKAFTVNGSLQKHMRIHSGEKPFSCSVCRKAFIDSGHLYRHMRIHTGERPFSCSVCRKAFIESGHLQKHMRTHTGERPFSCSVCKKAFKWSGDLQAHMRIHTGEKPFSCSVCKMGFTVGRSLHRHMRAQHPSVTQAPIVFLLPVYSTEVILI